MTVGEQPGPAPQPEAERRDGGAAVAALVDFEDVTVSLGGTLALDRVTLDISRGPPLVLIGPNGAGKTTLLKLGMGLLAPTRGRVLDHPGRGGRAVAKAFVFQRPVMLRRSAAANVAFALQAAGKRADRVTVASLLERVGLGGLGDRPARRLSGGEHQRLALARALALEPELLFLDEPTASLDPAATKAVEEIVGQLAGAGITIVISTHDLGQARRLGGEVLFLVGGRFVERAPAARFFAAPATPEARRFLAGEIVL